MKRLLIYTLGFSFGYIINEIFKENEIFSSVAGVLFKIIFAIVPIIILVYAYISNKELASCLSSGSEIPEKYIKIYKGEENKFEPEGLLNVGRAALVAAIAWGLLVLYLVFKAFYG
ncbi:MAG TPA: hypothetical protein ENJ08_08695 [Gammaproteobacteria bacterium]|nr:hypothetical protein [Gammaproteobacteria bacterium]